MSENKCINCKHFDNSGYITEKRTMHLGFCNRFFEVTNQSETCVCYLDNDSLEAKKLKQMEIDRINDAKKQQLELFDEF